MRFFQYFRQKRKEKMQPNNKRPACRYPLGDPQSKDFKFCCEPVERDRFVYCDKHAKICYTNFEDIKDKPRTRKGTSK